MRYANALALFWKHHPALFFGLALLFGFYSIFYHPLIALIPLILNWIPLTLCSYAGRSAMHLHWSLLRTCLHS